MDAKTPSKTVETMNASSDMNLDTSLCLSETVIIKHLQDLTGQHAKKLISRLIQQRHVTSPHILRPSNM